jgi:glyoxylase-like metal-dependent hydrolase (beta-lactamase superfamily II)
MGTQFAKQSRGRWLRGLPLFTIMLTVGAVAQADVFLNAYTRAQPVIERAVDAYGGVETVTSITSIHYREDNTASQRYQSRKLGPPFDTAPGATEIAWDRSSGNFLASFGGQFPAIQLVIGEDSQQIDMTRKVSTPPGAPIDPNTHFIHRIVPAMLAAKLYQRAQNVTWTGQTKIDGRLHDVLSIAWDTGQVYMVHIDAETGLIGRYDILLTDFVVGDAIAESYFEGYEDMDGIPTPTRRWQRIGDQQSFDARIKEVRYNADVSGMFETPEGVVRLDAAPPPASELRKLADGVWIGNGFYQNLYVEVGDFLVSVDAGGGTGVVKGDLAQLDKLTGGKPLRYSVITHHHSDHTNGVDALASTGSTLVTTRDNQDYLASIIRSRQVSGANATRVDPVEPKFLAIEDKHVIEAGGRRLEIHRVPNAHADDYYVVYLPKEKILYGADVFNLGHRGQCARADRYRRRIKGASAEASRVQLT